MKVHELNQSYEYLREFLDLVQHSPRNQMLGIERWWAEFGGPQRELQLKVYLRELLPVLRDACLRLDAVGTAPGTIDGTLSMLEGIRLAFPDLSSRAGIQEMIDAVAFQRDTIWSYLGEPSGIQAGGNLREGEDALALEQTEIERLTTWIDSLGSSGDPRSGQYQRIRETWLRRITTSTGTVHIPLVEEDRTDGAIGTFHAFGSIGRMILHVHPVAKRSEQDSFTFSFQSPDHAKERIDADLREVMRAVRGYAASVINGYADSRYLITVSYDDHDMAHQGVSHGLAFAMNMLSIFSFDSFDAKYHSVAGSAVLTGAVDSIGRITSLDPASIRRKVETVFYSPFSMLVLPEANLPEARQQLSSLQNVHPHRRLELLPAASLEEVFDRRKVMIRTDLTIRQRTGKKLRQYRKPIAATFVSLPLIAFLMFFIFGIDRDVNPVEVKVENNYYKFRNRNGKFLWSVPIGTKEQPSTITEYSGSAIANNVPHDFKYVDLFDMNADGLNEVLLFRPSPQKTGWSDILFCYGHDGTPIWQKKVGTPIITQEDDYSGSAFSANYVDGIHDTRTGNNFILCHSSDIYYANYLEILNPVDSIRRRFLNLGGLVSFRAMKNIDSGVNMSGVSIVSSGTHNGFHRPVVMMLDPEYVDGVCPQESPYKLVHPQSQEGTEKYYIRFPLSDVATLKPYIKNPYAGIRDIDTVINIVVYETKLPRVVDPDMTVTMLIYTFDLDMRLKGIQTSTQFDMLYDALSASGEIRRSKQQIKNDLMRNIEYWDGDKFVKHHAINRHYTEAVKRARSSP